MYRENAEYTYNGILHSLKKKIMLHATTRINFKDMICERSQKDKYCMISSNEVSKAGRVIETK